MPFSKSVVLHYGTEAKSSLNYQHNVFALHQFCPSANEYGEEEKGKYGTSLQAPLWIQQSPSCSGQLMYHQCITSDRFQGLMQWRWSSFATLKQTMKVSVMMPLTGS